MCGREWCRKAGIRAAAGAWVAGGSAADQRGAKKEAAEAWRGLRKGTAGASGAQERGGRRESERGSRKEGRGGGVPAAALNRSIEGPLLTSSLFCAII